MRRKIALLVLVMTFPAALSAQDLKKEFWQAARSGNAEKVKALIEKGVDVNTAFRYGATTLFYACDRGHIEVVKVLLEHGADVNVKDTFYGATALTWALSPPSKPATLENHYKIVALLLERGAKGAENVLTTGVQRGRMELVETALRTGGLSAEALTQALATATERGRTEIAERLKKAGAVLPPAIDPAILQKYAGRYSNGTGAGFEFVVENGKLKGGVAGQRKFLMLPTDENSFRLLGMGGVVIHFRVKEGTVSEMVLRQNRNEIVYTRVELEK